MRRASVRVLLAFAAVVASVAGCNEVTVGSGPSFPGERIYVLQSVGGEPLPYVWTATAGGDTTTLLNETIALRSLGRATRTSTWRTVVGGGPATIGAQSGQWVYDAFGSAITLQPICPEGALCIRGDSGRISDAQMTLSTMDVPDAPVHVYTRALPD